MCEHSIVPITTHEKFRCKKVFIVIIILLLAGNSFSQVGISNVAITPHTSSVLELRSTTTGFLPPRMTTTERNAVSSPATGLMIYNTTTSELNSYNGAAWQSSGTVNLTGDVTSVGSVTAIAANAIVTSDILNSNVTYAKIQNVSAASKILGRVTAGAGVIEEISVTGTGNVVMAITPTLTGVPSAPTAAAATSTTQLATTAFVTTADNLKANVASPTLTGVPAAPTAAAATNTTQLATTAFVTTADNLKANIASPTFTGVPAAPTAAAATNTTQLATTSFVTTADNLKANAASPVLTGVPEAPTAAPATNTTQLATTAFVTTADNLKANLASPTFTGVVTAPTPAAGTNTTQLATTAFVTAEGNLPNACFSSSITQLVTATTTAKLITFETDEVINSITHSITINPSRITIQVTGTYLITFSASLAGGVADSDIWLRQNGVDVARSNTRLHYLSTDTKVMTVTFLVTATTSDYFELVHSSTNLSGGPTAFPAGTNPTRPAIPSIILTINKISD